MSSSDDSETAEWEREQMLRGTQSQSRHQKQGSSRNQKQATAGNNHQHEQRPDVINASLAKQHVQFDIEQVERDIEITKRNIGSTRLDIVRSRKRLDAMVKQIEKLEASNRLFEALAELSEPKQVLELLNVHKQLISELPPDQQEMLISYRDRMMQSET